jgi:MarR family transcriptional regulator, 2-MHQ and catechol-resistance regulon repressor
MPFKKTIPDNTRLVLSSYIKLVRAADSVIARSHRHLSGPKLSFSQFAVLEALYHIGSLCQKDIAAKVLKSPRNITMVVDNLEKRGLVKRERNSGDRRFLDVSLTEEGRKLFEDIFPRHIEALKQEMEVLTPEELVELSRLCRILGTKVR